MTTRKHSNKYTTYLRSPAWYTKREAQIKRAGGTCEQCGKQTGLEVHHKHYRTLGREAAKDLMVLCKACHRKADAARKARTEGKGLRTEKVLPRRQRRLGPQSSVLSTRITTTKRRCRR